MSIESHLNSTSTNIIKLKKKKIYRCWNFVILLMFLDAGLHIQLKYSHCFRVKPFQPFKEEFLGKCSLLKRLLVPAAHHHSSKHFHSNCCTAEKNGEGTHKIHHLFYIPFVPHIIPSSRHHTDINILHTNTKLHKKTIAVHRLDPRRYYSINKKPTVWPKHGTPLCILLIASF